MQDPNEDTEWNDMLRKIGVLPPKVEQKEDDDEPIPEEPPSFRGKAYEDMKLEELDEAEEDIQNDNDNKFIDEYRKRRLQQLQALHAKKKFGQVMEISGIDYVDQVNKAGEDIWVVLHLYKRGKPLCALINEHLKQLAVKFPHTKFLQAISTTCIPNFPESNLPAIFVYYNGEMKTQLIGAYNFGSTSTLTVDVLEYIMSETKAIKTELEQDPRVDQTDRRKGIFHMRRNVNPDDETDEE